VTIENFRLIVFRAVARHSSFSRAAEELLLTQPAVTQQIKALEEQFGHPLFHRGGGRISLTPGGAALLPFAERIKVLSEDAFVAVAQAYGQEAGELSLGASQTIAQYLLPTFIAAFLKTNPHSSPARFRLRCWKVRSNARTCISSPSWKITWFSLSRRATSGPIVKSRWTNCRCNLFWRVSLDRAPVASSSRRLPVRA